MRVRLFFELRVCDFNLVMKRSFFETNWYYIGWLKRSFIFNLMGSLKIVIGRAYPTTDKLLCGGRGFWSSCWRQQWVSGWSWYLLICRFPDKFNDKLCLWNTLCRDIHWCLNCCPLIE